MIFGANKTGRDQYVQLKTIKNIFHFEIIAFLDNDSRLEGLSYDNIKIYNPRNINSLIFDKIIVSNIFSVQIKKQLNEIGVPDNKISFLYGREYFDTVNRDYLDIIIGRYSYFKESTKISSTIIGSFCHIGENCVIGLGGHDVQRVTTYPLGYHFLNINNDPAKDESSNLKSKTIIKNDVYIGNSVTIFSGVTIGNGAVIGAGAVVTKDVPDYAIIAGVPGKILRYRFESEIINSLLSIAWWNWSDDDIKKNYNLFNLDVFEFVKIFKKNGSI